MTIKEFLEQNGGAPVDIFEIAGRIINNKVGLHANENPNLYITAYKLSRYEELFSKNLEDIGFEFG